MSQAHRPTERELMELRDRADTRSAEHARMMDYGSVRSLPTYWRGNTPGVFWRLLNGYVSIWKPEHRHWIWANIEPDILDAHKQRCPESELPAGARN